MTDNLNVTVNGKEEQMVSSVYRRTENNTTPNKTTRKYKTSQTIQIQCIPVHAESPEQVTKFYRSKTKGAALI